MFSILPSQVWNSLVFLSIMYYKNLQQKNSILNLFLQDVVATQESQLLTAGPERPSSFAHPDEVNDKDTPTCLHTMYAENQTKCKINIGNKYSQTKWLSGQICKPS